MSDGKETSGMEDKAVSTMDDLEGINAAYFGGGAHWNAFAIEKLLTVLINNKIMSLRATAHTISNIDLEKSDSFMEESKEKEPPDKRGRQHRRHHSPHHRHHHHHCPKHAPCSEQFQQRSSSISKVQMWSEDFDTDSSPERAGGGGGRRRDTEEFSRERATDRRKKLSKERKYTVVDIESTKKTGPPKKRKRKKRKRVQQEKKKDSHSESEDLPKRARWTIIITSGLLILTCMFLVGVTLRMAPVIDQMVRTKNEELMNSLHRNNNPAYYSSVNPPQT